MICKSDALEVQQLKNDNQKVLLNWLSNPEVLRYYEGRDQVFTPEKIKQDFFSLQDEVVRCIVYYYKEPIGYLQFYEINGEEREVYQYGKEVIFGMDQFIGEPHFWNKGIGTRLITLVSQYLLDEKDADWVVVDPQTGNERAIRCYEKCGFEKVKLLPKRELHEGVYRDCWLMERRGKVV